MKRKATWSIMSLLVVVALLVVSCAQVVTEDDKDVPEQQEEQVDEEEQADEEELVEEASATAPMGIEISEGYDIQHILRPKLLGPGDVEIGPDGDIFVTEWDGQRIARISNDGTISTYVQPDFYIWAMAFNSAGELFSYDGENIVKVSPAGDTNIFIRDIRFGGMAFGPKDNLFVESVGNLLRFTPDGERTVIATGFSGGDMAISPTGEVYTANWPEGKIFKVDQDGVVTTLASGFVLDAFNIALDNEGNLYENQDYLRQVSLHDGSLGPPLIQEYNVLLNSRPFVFDRSDNVVLVGPTTNTLIRASLDGENVECLVEGIGNSYALVVDPHGDILMGASNAFPLVPGKIIKISADGTVSDFATDFTELRDMIYDNLGNLYVSNCDHSGGTPGSLIRIRPDGTRTTILSGYYDLISTVFVPSLGNIIAFELENRRFLTITPEGNVEDIFWDFGGEVCGADLALDQHGNIIALIVFEENYNIGPVHRGLFRITPDDEITLITNIDTPLATSEDDVFVHPSGDIFVVGPEEHPDFRLLRITPSGEISVVARKLPFDTLSLTMSQAGEIFFTCSAGLFKVTEKQSN